MWLLSYIRSSCTGRQEETAAVVANGSQEQEEQEEEQEAANRWAMPIANSHPWRHSGHWVMPMPILGNAIAIERW